jgi:hypothetical protein
MALPNLNLILSAHGSPIRDPRRRVEELIAHRQERTREVLSIIQAADKPGASSRDILKTLYKGPDKQKRMFAEGWVRLTLDYLEKTGEITATRSGAGKGFYYRPTGRS